MINPDASSGADDYPVPASFNLERVECDGTSSGDVCLSVIMVLHNSEEALSHSAPALATEIGRMRDRCKTEALFVDNASSAEPSEIISSYIPQGRVIRLSKNVGFAAGCNVGAREARGEYLFFLNPDVILDPGAVDELLKTLNDKPDAWAVSGRMRNPDSSFQATCRELPTKSNIFWSRGSSLNVLFRGNGKKGRGGYTLPDFSTTTAVAATAATALLIRRTIFEKLGGFDERFFMFMEDTDLSAEIQEQGGKIYFCPQAGAVHAWGAGSQASTWRRSRWHHASVWLYYRKRVPGFFSTVVLPLALLTNFLVFACVSFLKGNDSRGIDR